MKTKIIVRGALLIALALVLQSLRLLVPIPPLASAFIIGTLVHLMLVVTLKANGMATACLLAFLLPLTAYTQGQLLFPFLIPVVWLGNLLFIILLHYLSKNRKLEVFLPALVKAVVMGLAAWLAMYFIAVSSVAVQKTITIAMTVPQFITGVLGVLLARKIMVYMSKII